MYTKFDILAYHLNLSKYQSNKIKIHYDRYNISRLEKRGGLLYAPYCAGGIWARVLNLFCGTKADLIGPNKILLQAQRNIKFCANGYHCVRVGREWYFANAQGNVISQSEFLRNINN